MMLRDVHVTCMKCFECDAKMNEMITKSGWNNATVMHHLLDAVGINSILDQSTILSLL